jgi:hypothetical protein
VNYQSKMEGESGTYISKQTILILRISNNPGLTFADGSLSYWMSDSSKWYSICSHTYLCFVRMNSYSIDCTSTC